MADIGMAEGKHISMDPSPVKISTYTMGCDICAGDNNKLELHIFSRLVPIIYDDKSLEVKELINSEKGCYVAISNYTDSTTNDMMRGITNCTSTCKLPSQIFNNQITIIYKYLGFRSVSFKIFSNGHIQLTGIMDPIWEPKHIASNVINILNTLKYRVHFGEEATWGNRHDYILYWNNAKSSVDFYRRNIEIYSVESLKNSGVVYTYNNNKWFNSEQLSVFINSCIASIPEEIKYLESIMDNMRSVETFTQELRDKLIGPDETSALYRYRNITRIETRYRHLKDCEFLKLITVLIRKIDKTFRNYRDRLIKLLNTDMAIATYINNNYADIIGVAYNDYKKLLDDRGPVAEIGDDDNIFKSYIDIDTELTKRKFKISNIQINLINSDFNTRNINNLSIISRLLTTHNIYNYYRPNDNYPGIIAKFLYNRDYITPEALAEGKQPGLCYCQPKHCMTQHDSERKCVKITVNIFRTGSIMITAARSIEQINYVYKYINSFLQKYAGQVYLPMTKEHNYYLDNEKRKIINKNELHYFAKSAIIW